MAQDEDFNWDLEPTDDELVAIEAMRPSGMSNSAWALAELGYPPVEPYWGWTRQYRRQP